MDQVLYNIQPQAIATSQVSQLQTIEGKKCMTSIPPTTEGPQGMTWLLLTTEDDMTSTQGLATQSNIYIRKYFVTRMPH
jgi:hypothetical protein